MAGYHAVRGAVRQETELCCGWAVSGSPRHEPNRGGSVRSVQTAAVCGTVVNTTCGSIVSLWCSPAAALSLIVRAAPSGSSISPGSWPSLGLAYSLWANLAYLKLSRALAGVRTLSAATIPSGVDRNAPNVDLPIWLIAFWYSHSMFFPPFQVSSAAYSIVPCIMLI